MSIFDSDDMGLVENQPDRIPVTKRLVDDQTITPQQYSDPQNPEANTITPAQKPNDQSKVDDDQILLQKTPDQIEGKWPGSNFRVLPREAYWVSKTLNPKDVILTNAELHICAYDACILTRGYKIVESPPGLYKTNLMVFDEGGIKYDMVLSSHVLGEHKRYSISGEWEKFVKAHNLQAGDKISFCRILDLNDSDDYAYILKYGRKCLDNKDIVDANNSIKPSVIFDHRNGRFIVEYRRAASLENSTLHKRKRNEIEIGPGSSIHHLKTMTREAYCTSKTLTSIEVVQKDAKLYFDPYNASVLVDCPTITRYPLEKYSKNLLVFDKNNRKYFMNLSECVSGGEIRSYCINTGWPRFLRIHKLKEGDELMFYRFRKTGCFKLEYYYVLKYFRKPKDVFDQCKSIKPSEDAVIKDKQNGLAEIKVTQKRTKNTILPSKKKRESKVRCVEGRLESTCDGKKKNAHEPDFRALKRGTFCLSKTLSTKYGLADQGNPKLYFDANEAWLLTNSARILENCPFGTILMNILACDEDNRQYDMVLLCFKSGDGETIYTLDGGWQRFVKLHNLKAGDKIIIYRIQDKSVYGESYYIRYTRSRQAGCVRPEMNGKGNK
ncbi:hypothetical protein CASFOL_005708 [Castilleja foliolosa]|uniref:B3 domain-containing protein n=1 Tax=Castilleja foliolosa TaxID=1961234 RepID=A0ABD3E481_9LAMI